MKLSASLQEALQLSVISTHTVIPLGKFKEVDGNRLHLGIAAAWLSINGHLIKSTLFVSFTITHRSVYQHMLEVTNTLSQWGFRIARINHFDHSEFIEG